MSPSISTYTDVDAWALARRPTHSRLWMALKVLLCLLMASHVLTGLAFVKSADGSRLSGSGRLRVTDIAALGPPWSHYIRLRRGSTAAIVEYLCLTGGFFIEFARKTVLFYYSSSHRGPALSPPARSAQSRRRQTKKELDRAATDRRPTQKHTPLGLTTVLSAYPAAEFQRRRAHAGTGKKIDLSSSAIVVPLYSPDREAGTRRVLWGDLQISIGGYSLSWTRENLCF